MFIKNLLIVILWLAMFGTSVFGNNQSDIPLTTKSRAIIIDSVAVIFSTKYIYPSKGARIDSLLREKLADGAYNHLSSLAKFTQSIENDLFEITNDRHIAVEPIPDNPHYVTEGDSVTDEQITKRSKRNFGWTKLEFLPGAVGYIKLDRFEDTTLSLGIAEAAMNFMAHSRALIIDLRDNHGGGSILGNLISNYFFEKPTHLGGFYWPYLDSTDQTWTDTNIAGPPLYDLDLYLLTSRHTASAAEAFCYSLKHCGRAIVIGEKTVGAAHWSDWYEFPELGIVVHVPVARPVHPVTGTDWEGTGVLPDLEVPAQNALNTAYAEALTKLKAKATRPEERQMLDWIITAARAKANPIILADSLARKYVGEYAHPDGKRKIIISYEDGELRYLHFSGDSFGLIPMTESLFTFSDGDEVRLRFDTDALGKVTRFVLIEPDGSAYVRTRVYD